MVAKIKYIEHKDLVDNYIREITQIAIDNNEVNITKITSAAINNLDADSDLRQLMGISDDI